MISWAFSARKHVCGCLLPARAESLCYRTNDGTIAINTVVMVPAGDEIKPEIVTNHDPVWVYEIEAFDAMMND